MPKNNFFTPDNQMTPHDDPEKMDCIECNGTGQIIEWDEDDVPDHTRCPKCKGEGWTEREEDDHDWD